MQDIKKTLERIEKKLDAQATSVQDLKGTNRKCDSLGRITLPMSIRKSLDISEGTEIKVCQQDDYIILIPS